MSGIGRLSTLEWPLSIPLTTPTPTELNSRNGLPIAIASCPGLTFDESANSRGSMSATSSGSTFNTARSSAGLAPSFLGDDLAPVGQSDDELAARHDDVLIGHQVTLVVEEEPGTGGQPPGSSREPTVRETSISTTAWLVSS